MRNMRESGHRRFENLLGRWTMVTIGEKVDRAACVDPIYVITALSLASKLSC